METIFLILTLVSAVLLIAIISIQDNKGGAGSAMGASGVSQMVGARRGADIVENATKILAGIFIVCAVLTTVIKKSAYDEKQAETEQAAGKGQQQEQPKGEGEEK